MLTEAILRRWRKVGLISDNPTSIEREMAEEAAIAIRMAVDTESQYDISWRLVITIVVCTLLFIGSLFYFLL